MMNKKKACDACHKRKIQCDASASDSQCNWCSHHGLTCTFNRVRGRRKTRNTRSKLGSEGSLSQRIGRIESVLAQTIALKEARNSSPATSSTSTPPSLSSATATRPSSESIRGPTDYVDGGFGTNLSVQPTLNFTNSTQHAFGQIHFAGYHLGHISCHNGIPFFSEKGQQWINTRTGETDLFRDLSGPQPLQSFAVSPSSSNGFIGTLHTLPDRSIVEELIHEFQNTGFRLVFPVIDRILFADTVELAYSEGKNAQSLENITARACVLAFLSILVLFQANEGKHFDVDSDSCAMKAYYLLSDVLEDASINSLQTVFMLHLHQTFSGRLQSAATLHGIACRKMLMLGGCNNVDAKWIGGEISRVERERRHIRMLFWLCYVFDKDIALRTGQPPILVDEYCDLTFPDRYLEDHFLIQSFPRVSQGPHFADENIVPHLPGDLRLSILKGKTCRALYSMQATRKSDAELLRDIRELDSELESWRQSIPAEFRPALSIRENVRYDSTWRLPQSMQRIAMHLEYHYLMTAIHRASGRCLNLDMVDEHEEFRDHGVHSSLALSVEASRSTIFYLRAAVSGLANEAFWIIVFYPMSALMTLFFNILLHPLDPQSKADVELLDSASNLIRDMTIRRLTHYEVVHIKLMNDFVMELIRLGKCAIEKATREREQRRNGLEYRPSHASCDSV